MKISVCLASYNGSKYIGKQISSILVQLGQNDELIISDDGSTDDTIQIIKSFNEKRIVLISNEKVIRTGRRIYSHYLVSSNFENALKKSSGDVIFLADQDDIWTKNKIEVMLSHLENYSLVMSDCSVINDNEEILSHSFFNGMSLPRGILKNISKPLYHGCCMAFRKEILNVVLPFPRRTILHDSWIGILAENFGDVKFINDKLVLYRRHFDNSSFLQGKSKNSIFFRVKYRVVFFFQITGRLILVRINRIINNIFN